jgi:hypothetical protein
MNADDNDHDGAPQEELEDDGMPQEILDCLSSDERSAVELIMDHEIGISARNVYARSMSKYSTYLRDTGKPGLLDDEDPWRSVTSIVQSKPIFYPNRLDYSNLNVDNFKGFLAMKRNEKGSSAILSHGAIRKFKDALYFHCRVLKVRENTF